MKFERTEIPGCFVVIPDIISDERGWFARTFCEEEARPFLGEIRFVQFNHSFNVKKGTFRGMHYQLPPHTEGKLIRCVAGKVLDLVLDLRKGSPAFLKWIPVELSAGNRKSVFIPEGCAHGFQTLENNSELIYSHTAFYHKESDRGIRYDDPAVDIKLPVSISAISEKDKSYGLLNADFKGLEL